MLVKHMYVRVYPSKERVVAYSSLRHSFALKPQRSSLLPVPLVASPNLSHMSSRNIGCGISLR